MARENKKGQFTKEVKKTKDAARVSNDKEVAEKALADVQASIAEELKKATDNGFAIGYDRGRVTGFQEGMERGQSKGRKTAFSAGLIMGASVVLIAAFLAVYFAGQF